MEIHKYRDKIPFYVRFLNPEKPAFGAVFFTFVMIFFSFLKDLQMTGIAFAGTLFLLTIYISSQNYKCKYYPDLQPISTKKALMFFSIIILLGFCSLAFSIFKG
jgi:hypothetical protein